MTQRLLQIMCLSFFCMTAIADPATAPVPADITADTATTDAASAETPSTDAVPPNTEAEPAMTAEEKAYWDKAKALWESLDRKTGTIELPGGIATLNVPDTFYYLGPDDAQKVLVEAWGNPPGEEKPLGMLFPTGMTPYDHGAWGATIEYSEEGYVKDDDADDIDYDDLLKDMKEDTTEASAERVKQGYQAIELIGWAEPPTYDKNAKKLHWAKELHFGDDTTNTLNYNIRVLGRKGILIINFIAGIEQLPEIKQNISPVLSMAEFNDGHRYADFNPDIDKVAAYGLGGLIAGTALVKTGAWAVILVFLKKFGVILVVALGAAAKKIMGLLKK